MSQTTVWYVTSLHRVQRNKMKKLNFFRIENRNEIKELQDRDHDHKINSRKVKNEIHDLLL